MRCDDLCNPLQALAYEDVTCAGSLQANANNSVRDVSRHVRGALHMMSRVVFGALSGRCSPTPRHLTAPMQSSETNMYWRCVGKKKNADAASLACNLIIV